MPPRSDDRGHDSPNAPPIRLNQCPPDLTIEATTRPMLPQYDSTNAPRSDDRGHDTDAIVASVVRRGFGCQYDSTNAPRSDDRGHDSPNAPRSDDRGHDSPNAPRSDDRGHDTDAIVASVVRRGFSCQHDSTNAPRSDDRGHGASPRGKLKHRLACENITHL